MVKKLLIFLAYSAFFIFALMLFIPKASLYFFFEKELKNYEVVISKEQLKENLLSLDIHNLELSAKGIDTALIKDASVTLLGISNSVDLEKIKLSSLVEAYLPSKIEHLEINYTLFNPLNITAAAQGEFGEARASFNITSRALRVVLKPSKKMLSRYRNSLRKFKKSKEGEYIYAKSI
jgi:hypothetical protein